LDTLQSGTIHREIYAQSASDGLTVFHTKNGTKAEAEIEAIKDEVMRILDNGI